MTQLLTHFPPNDQSGVRGRERIKVPTDFCGNHFSCWEVSKYSEGSGLKNYHFKVVLVLKTSFEYAFILSSLVGLKILTKVTANNVLSLIQHIV